MWGWLQHGYWSLACKHKILVRLQLKMCIFSSNFSAVLSCQLVSEQSQLSETPPILILVDLTNKTFLYMNLTCSDIFRNSPSMHGCTKETGQMLPLLWRDTQVLLLALSCKEIPGLT